MSESVSVQSVNGMLRLMFCEWCHARGEVIICTRGKTGAEIGREYDRASETFDAQHAECRKGFA